MSFWSDVGNWLGNAFGVNQANAAQAGRQQAESGLQGLGQYGGQAAGAANQALGYTQGSLGANAGETLQKATTAGMQTAKQIASQTGNVAGRQAASAARTGGLNKGQAALSGGQAAGSAAAAALPQAEQQQIGNYYTGTGQGLQLQGQAGNQAVSAYGGQAQQGAGFAGTQGSQGQLGAGAALSMIPKLKEGGITSGMSISGEDGPEAVIPVKKLLKVAPRSLAEVLKVIRPQVEAQTTPAEGEGKNPTMDDLIRRIEALEKK